MKFERAKVNVVMFANEDVVTASTNDGHEHNYPLPPTTVGNNVKSYVTNCLEPGCTSTKTWTRGKGNQWG